MKMRRTPLLAMLASAIACQMAPSLAAEHPKTPETPTVASEPSSSALGQEPAATDAPTGQGTDGLRIEQIRSAQEQALRRRAALLAPETAIQDPEARRALLERWGVVLKGVRKAAGGYMIDFRFRVVDAEKALPLFDPKVQPYLLREGSDIKLPVPVGEKVGAFRTTNRGKNIQSNKDYYMLFANPDAYVEPGDKVSVVIGDFRVDGLTLQSIGVE
jgi:hypothetical protein